MKEKNQTGRETARGKAYEHEHDVEIHKQLLIAKQQLLIAKQQIGWCRAIASSMEELCRQALEKINNLEEGENVV